MSHQDVEGYYFNEEMIKYFEDFRLYSLQFEINTDCGQHCKYCYVNNSTAEPARLEDDFVLSVLDQLAEMKVAVIEWLGGDPVRHPSFDTFLRSSIDLGLRNNIWSSGDLLNAEVIVDFLTDDTNEGFVSFHLDTLDPEIYRRLACSPEYIDVVLKNIEFLLDQGVNPERLNNCFTFTRLQGPDDLENTVRTLHEEYGILSGIVPYKPVGYPTDAMLYIPTTEEIHAAYRLLSEIQFGSKMPITPQCVSKYYCGTTCALTIEKGLTLCTRIRQPLVRIHGTDFKTAFESAKYTLLRGPLRDTSNRCESCRSCGNNEICWGCRGNAFYYAGDFMGPDVKCWNYVAPEM